MSNLLLNKLPSNIGALRLDYGFTKQDIVDLTNNAPYLIELNASTTTKEYLEELTKLPPTIYIDDVNAFHYLVSGIICYANYHEKFK